MKKKDKMRFYEGCTLGEIQAMSDLRGEPFSEMTGTFVSEAQMDHTIQENELSSDVMVSEEPYLELELNR